MKSDPEGLLEGWPWCDHCQSYHHPANPTCLRPGLCWSRLLTSVTWQQWLMLAVGFWILGDVAPAYHTTHPKAAHDVYTFLGSVALGGSLSRMVNDARRSR